MTGRCHIGLASMFRLSLAALFLAVLPANGQDLGRVVSPVLVVDTERVFQSSQIGQKITADLEAKLAALVAENRIIEEDLVAEELALTQQRATLDPVAFRALADLFDQKVQEIRSAQDQKQRELQLLQEAENNLFLDSIGPILSAIGRERGAYVVLDRRSVLLSADTIDITQEAIARLNAVGTEAIEEQITPQE